MPAIYGPHCRRTRECSIVPASGRFGDEMAQPRLQLLQQAAGSAFLHERDGWRRIGRWSQCSGGSGPGGRIIERDVEAVVDRQPRMSPVARAMLDQGGYAAPRQGSGPRWSRHVARFRR